MQPGHRLGPYEIVSRIGAGGMGVVWRARDTRLDRQVAIKVLSTEFAHSALLKQRFEREAKTISSLNHPHICTLFDVGSEDGTSYLVMELLEGESLAERLARGPLPLPEVLRIGVQVAEALHKAHRQQIVHRDLKPGNIMLTKSGAKLLDFGLAKTGVLSISPDDATQKPLTQEGTILGTFQYMSPEQLEGQEADARSDLFAFGTVLYEMATARPAFTGKNRTSLIAAIVSGEPVPINSLQPLTPPALEHVIDKCLAKDPEDRWQSAHDVAEELRWIGEAGSKAGLAAPVISRRNLRDRLWMMTAALFVLLVVGLSARLLSLRRSNPVGAASEVNPPLGMAFQLEGLGAASLSISPNGRLLVFRAADEKGKGRLWMRAIDSLEARPIDGTEDAGYPFWSPDSRSLGFFAEGKMKRIDLSGGPPTTICDAGSPRGASWSSDGTIIYEPVWQQPLWRVPATGGKAEQLTKLDPSRSETTHRYPWFLPDGKHYLYLAASHAAEVNSDLNAIYVGVLGSAERKLVLRARSNVAYSAGYLLFVRQNYLLAQKFDLKKLEVSGEPMKLATNVHYDSGVFRGVFAAGGDTLLYHPSGGDSRQQLTWVDRAGKELGTVGEPDDFNAVRFSPDGNKVLAQVGDTSDLWIYDLPHSTRTRFTSDPMDEIAGVWSPDGRNIIFSSDRSGVVPHLYIKPADGATPEQLLLPSEFGDYASDWSKDGRFLAFNRSVFGKDSSDIYLLPMTGEKRPIPFATSRFSEGAALFSPDGKWASYNSDESGRRELYVAPVPGPGPKQQVSTAGARGNGGWSKQGDQLQYLAPDRTIMQVQVTAGAAFDFKPAVAVGKLPPANAGGSPDGEKFLLALRKNFTVPPLVLMTNWTNRAMKVEQEDE